MSTLNQDLETIGLHTGRMISPTKEGPEGHVCFFNACIFDGDFVQVWYGDIDVTQEQEKLELLALGRGENIYVTREQPFRWDGLDKKTAKRESGNTVVIFRPHHPAVLS